MKKLMMIVTLLVVGNMLLAQTQTTTTQSTTTKNTAARDNFSSKYPNATNVYWQTDKNNMTRVNYIDKDVRHALVYDNTGNIVREEAVITQTEVPGSINEYYKKRDPNAAGYTVWQVKDKDGNLLYYSEYQGKTSYFDKNGNITTRNNMATGDDKDPIDNTIPKDK